MMWSVHLQHLLRHGHSRFTLAVRFESAAQRLVLFGPSGSGKTQTLRAIAGILRPSAGTVRVNDQTLLDTPRGIDLPARDRRMACVFQEYALFPHLTVRQNIAFAATRGLRNPQDSTRHAGTEAWIERFGLQQVAGHRPHQISGGQRQRTALARALVSEPRALLLDEPFAALDSPLRRRLRQELLELQQSLQIPLLLITHDEEDAAVLGQETITLRDGQVVAAGTLESAVP